MEATGSVRTGLVRRAAVLGIASPVLFVLLVVVMGFVHPRILASRELHQRSGCPRCAVAACATTEFLSVRHRHYSSCRGIVQGNGASVPGRPGASSDDRGGYLSFRHLSRAFQRSRFSRVQAMTPVLVAMFVLMARADASPTGAPGLFQRLFIPAGGCSERHGQGAGC